jgi:hypothetical protein
MRRANSYSIPLQLFGAPMALVSRSLGPVSSVVTKIPFVGHEMHSAVPVETVAKAAVLSAMGPVEGNTLDATSMLALAESFHDTVHDT